MKFVLVEKFLQRVLWIDFDGINGPISMTRTVNMFNEVGCMLITLHINCIYFVT